MADPTRRAILEMLRGGERSAGDIADEFAVTRPAISHHLSVLKAAGLLVERREGQRVIYALEPGSIVAVWEGFLSKLCSRGRQKKGSR